MKFFFAALLTFVTLPVFSQFHLTGKLIDGVSQTPIDFGNVALYLNGNYLKSTEPNKNGDFRFENLTKGNYKLETKIIGFVDYSNEINLSKNLNIGTLNLQKQTLELEGIAVIHQKKQVIYKLDKKIISAGSDIISGTGGTATDILSRVPSIRIDPDGNVSFRGTSGFLVQVNGKPTVFSAAQTLQQIPANQIENIEIITTPSARNQTDGEVGIINIITKQKVGEGFSGAVNTFGSTYKSRGIDFILNKQTGDHRFNLSGFYGQRFRKSDFEQEKTTIVADTTVTSHSEGPRKGEYYGYTLQAGWQLIKKKSDFYANIIGGYEGGANKGDLRYFETVRYQNKNNENNHVSKDNYDLHETLFAGSVGFNHKFNDQNHTLKGYFYLKYGGNALERFESDLMDKDNKRVRGHRADEAEHRWTVDGRLDYVFPYSKSGHIESGYQYFSYLEDGDYSMEYWNPSTSEFYFRDDIYNTFYFQRGINSIYGIINQKIGRLEVQTGIRAEHTHQVLRSSKEWANRIQDRLEYFPSAHLAVNTNESTSFTAAYSRRTNRPELYYMEPYITFRDYYTAEIGNPDIRPEYIHSCELSFKKTKNDHNVQITIFHRNRTDKIERLRVPYMAGITLDSMANVGNDYSSGAELSLNIKPNKVWQFTLNGNVYHYKIENRLKEGHNESSINYGFSLINNLSLFKYTSIQLDGTLIGPTVRTQGRQEGFFYTDFGLRQQVFKNKMTLGLSFRNFLNTAKYKSRIETSNLISETLIVSDYPLITLNLGFTFNNFKQRQRNREGSDFFEGTNY